MDIKVLGIINNKELFEKELREYINKGYKIVSSNITSVINSIYKNTVDRDIYFYALLQKN